MSKDTPEWIKKHIQELKDTGKWTECHEKGHDIISPQNLTCRRCGVNFGDIVPVQGSN